MTASCPACGHDSDCTYRCEECGRDLVEEGDQEIATDGGFPEYLTELDRLTGGTIIRCTTCGAEAETKKQLDHHEKCPDAPEVATDGGLPLAGGQDDDEPEFFVVDEDRATVVEGPYADKQDAVAEATDRSPGHIVATRRSLDLLEATSQQTIRWENEDDDVDVITDGGTPLPAGVGGFAAPPEARARDWVCTTCGEGYHGRPAVVIEPMDCYCSPDCCVEDTRYLRGPYHWCDICDRPFSDLERLAGHECLVTDGGEPDGAIDNSFADAEQPALHVGDHVSDREGDDEPMLVTGLPGESADEWVVDTFDATVAELNEDYPATDEVVQVCYPQRTDTSLGLDRGESQTEYSFPRSRLQLEEPIHDIEDGDRDE